MGELEPVGVEELARGFFFRIAFWTAIDRIAEDGGSEMFEMDADLVGAARVGTDENQADGLVERKDFDAADGFLASAWKDGHLFSVDGVAANGSVDRDVGRAAEANGEVGLLHLSGCKGMDEFLMRQRRFRRQKDARGLLVETVDDPRSERIADGGQVLAMGEERVDKGAVWVSGGGVDDHSGRLVDGDQMLVFIEDVEGDCLGGEGAFGGKLKADLDLVICFCGNSFFDRLAIEKDKAVLDQLLEVGAGKEGIVEGEQLVDPLPCFVGLDAEGVWGQRAKPEVVCIQFSRLAEFISPQKLWC